MIKYQYLRYGNLALTIATKLDREDGCATYSFTMKHPKDKFVKKEAIKCLHTNDGSMLSVDMHWWCVEIDDSLTRSELLLAVLCDIYAKHRLHIPRHYRVFIMDLMMNYNEKVFMEM